MSATADRGTMETVAIPRSWALAPEDRARADFYALLARLYADPPDAALLAAIARAAPLGDNADDDPADDAPPTLPGAWNALRAASAAMDPDAAIEEYNDLFIGVGKSAVNLHASHWLTGFMMEKPLVEVRATLGRLGLARRAGVSLLEDHLAALCETMRILIAGQAQRAPAAIAEQRAFFERHIATWVEACCTAIFECPVANYYRHVAQLTQSYLAIERDSLAIDD
jgi:TorA maturation chaperone TorD